jgi:hypothetical protein
MCDLPGVAVTHLDTKTHQHVRAVPFSIKRSSVLDESKIESETAKTFWNDGGHGGSQIAITQSRNGAWGNAQEGRAGAAAAIRRERRERPVVTIPGGTHE